MQLDGDLLLTRMQADWPTEYELTRLRTLVDLQAQRISELEAATATPGGGFTTPSARAYGGFSDPDGGES